MMSTMAEVTKLRYGLILLAPLILLVALVAAGASSAAMEEGRTYSVAGGAAVGGSYGLVVLVLCWCFGAWPRYVLDGSTLRRWTPLRRTQVDLRAVRRVMFMEAAELSGHGGMRLVLILDRMRIRLGNPIVPCYFTTRSLLAFAQHLVGTGDPDLEQVGERLRELAHGRGRDGWPEPY
jgi:hypothetical protein